MNIAKSKCFVAVPKMSWRQCSAEHVAVIAIQQSRLRLTAFKKVSKG